MRGDPVFLGTPEQVFNNMVGSLFFLWLIVQAAHFFLWEVPDFWWRLKQDKRRYDFLRSFDVELDTW